MAPDFDPYYKWLGIPPKHQPPNHYRLLGIELFEPDREVIDAAATRMMTHLKALATGDDLATAQKLLNEVAAARLCLLNSARKAAYDAQLQAPPTSTAPVAGIPEPPPPLPVQAIPPPPPRGRRPAPEPLTPSRLTLTETNQAAGAKGPSRRRGPGSSAWLTFAATLFLVAVVACLVIMLSGRGPDADGRQSRSAMAKRETPKAPLPAEEVRPKPPERRPAVEEVRAPPVKDFPSMEELSARAAAERAKHAMEEHRSAEHGPPRPRNPEPPEEPGRAEVPHRLPERDRPEHRESQRPGEPMPADEERRPDEHQPTDRRETATSDELRDVSTPGAGDGPRRADAEEDSDNPFRPVPPRADHRRPRPVEEPPATVETPARVDPQVSPDEPDAREHPLPQAAHGFAGEILGKVVAKRNNAVVLNIERVMRVSPEVSRAERPQSLHGKNVLIAAFDRGRHAPEIVRYLGSLEVDDDVMFDVRHLDGNRLTVMELSEGQRRELNQRRGRD